MNHQLAGQEPLYGEPTLDEVFNDPIVRLLMAFDGVEHETLRPMLANVAHKIQ